MLFILKLSTIYQPRTYYTAKNNIWSCPVNIARAEQENNFSNIVINQEGFACPCYLIRPDVLTITVDSYQDLISFKELYLQQETA